MYCTSLYPCQRRTREKKGKTLLSIFSVLPEIVQLNNNNKMLVLGVHKWNLQSFFFYFIFLTLMHSKIFILSIFSLLPFHIWLLSVLPYMRFFSAMCFFSVPRTFSRGISSECCFFPHFWRACQNQAFAVAGQASGRAGRAETSGTPRKILLALPRACGCTFSPAPARSLDRALPLCWKHTLPTEYWESPLYSWCPEGFLWYLNLGLELG